MQEVGGFDSTIFYFSIKKGLKHKITIIQTIQPDMYKKLRELEDEISNDYLSKSTEDLKEFLREYWTLHVEAIEEFENQDDLDLKVNEVKEQIREELHAV